MAFAKHLCKSKYKKIVEKKSCWKYFLVFSQSSLIPINELMSVFDFLASLHTYISGNFIFLRYGSSSSVLIKLFNRRATLKPMREEAQILSPHNSMLEEVFVLS